MLSVSVKVLPPLNLRRQRFKVLQTELLDLRAWDATFVTGVNTAGTVRVNGLANLEATFNLISFGLQALAIAMVLSVSSGILLAQYSIWCHQKALARFCHIADRSTGSWMVQ